jgi:muconolactone delta-isomerase
MEYLVTMTTRVPDGIPDETVQDVRAREAVRARELAAQGHLLRLWRPPLQPGEWRTLGLFAADNDDQLERVLASMPLRIWRTDQVTPLSKHPNDPAPGRDSPQRTTDPELGEEVEFLTTFTVTVPDGAADEVVHDLTTREAQAAHQLARQGKLVRLWALPAEPGTSRALGLWRAQNLAELQAILASLPLDRWMTTRTTSLTEHPNDPRPPSADALSSARSG